MLTAFFIVGIGPCFLLPRGLPSVSWISAGRSGGSDPLPACPKHTPLPLTNQ